MGNTPIKVVTVEREYGSRGGEFAHGLAERLGWRLLDSELVMGAARAAGVDPKRAAELDERLDPWYYRYGKVLWRDTGYQRSGFSDDLVFDSERMRELVRQQIQNAAKEGHCVLVGRGAACALAGQPGCFHIFVYATSRAKKEWFARSFPEQAEQAEQQLAALDKRRAAVIRQFYQQEWCSRGLYHMLLNSCIGIESMIAAVQSAAGLGVPETVSAPGSCPEDLQPGPSSVN
jgi:hypothetical protein